MLHRFILTTSTLALLALPANAEPVELSQTQLRQLVSQNQILGAQQIIAQSEHAHFGQVIDVRGFLEDGSMVYRVLLQRNDGTVIEVLVDGPSGRPVSHQSNIGQLVSAAARGVSANNGNSQRPNSPPGLDRAASNDRGNSNGGGNGGGNDRGNSGGNDRGNGGGNGRGNGG